MDTTRPPLMAGAFICEHLLTEADGTNSAIRIVDRVRHQAIGPEPPEAMPPVFLRLFLVIGLYADQEARTEYEVGVGVNPPVGEPVELGTYQFVTESEGQPAWVATRLDFTALHEGTYWFPVAVNGTPQTRIPLRIEYQRLVIAKADEQA